MKEQEEQKVAESKSKVVQQVLDDEVRQIRAYFNDEKYVCEKFGYIYSSASGEERLYAIVAPSSEDTDSLRVIAYDKDKDAMVFMSENTSELEKKIFSEWRGEAEVTTLSQIEFEDFIIGESEWKNFKNSASQEELTVVALGAKFKSAGKKFFTKALISFLGTIISIIIGILTFKSFGLLVIIGGYVGFSLLAIKLMSYTSTLDDCYDKLNKENRKYVNSFFEEKGFTSFFKNIIISALFFFTIPYRALLFFIEMVIPTAADWCTAHGGFNGAVITLPKGYDIGGLREVGEYYKSCKLLDAVEEHLENEEQAKKERTKAYEYMDESGTTHTVYSEDGERFYSEKDLNSYSEVGKSENGGDTITITKKD